MGLYMDRQQLAADPTIPKNGQHNLCGVGTGTDFPGSQLFDVAAVGQVGAIYILLYGLKDPSRFAITPRVFYGVSQNQLSIFVIANLLTGAVNLSMYTLYATKLVGMLVISGYMLLVSLLGFSMQTRVLKL